MSEYISIQEAIDRLSEVLSSEAEFEKAKQVIIEAPTLDEKEIIRKMVERVVDMLESIEIGGDCRHKCNHYDWTVGACNGECTDYVKSRAIKIIKEECGISERD